MKRRISDDVSIGEMLKMREQGMTNHDIAKSLGCNYVTILRYIGKQPKGLDRIKAFTEEPAKPVQEISSEKRWKPRLKVEHETVSAYGITAEIDYSCESVKTAIDISFSAIPDLVSMALELARRIEEAAPGMVVPNERQR